MEEEKSKRQKMIEKAGQKQRIYQNRPAMITLAHPKWSKTQQELKKQALGDKDIYIANLNITDQTLPLFLSVDLIFVEEIDLSFNQFSGVGIMTISEKMMPNLRKIVIEDSQLEGNHLKCLPKASWIRLQHFDFQSNSLKGIGAKYLSLCHWPHLQTLALQNTGLEDDGFKNIANGSHFPKLKNLYTSVNQIGKCSFLYIFASNMPLENFEYEYNDFSCRKMEAPISKKYLGLNRDNMQNDP